MSGEIVGVSIYQCLCGDIIQGYLCFGQKLWLDQLCGVYVVLVSMLCEVLVWLVIDGFVLVEGQCGFEVVLILVKGLYEIVDLWLLIEEYVLVCSFVWGMLDWELWVVVVYYKLDSYEEYLEVGDIVYIDQWW